MARSLAPFGEPNFRLLWTGQAVSAIGDSLTPVAFAFATLSVTHSAAALGVVLAVSTVARVLALPMGGVWADRLPRQLVMLSSDWVRALVHGVIGFALIAGHATLWMLIAQAAMFSFAGGFFDPASGALVPQTVSAERLQQANALMGLSRSITQVAGPAVSGIIVALFGAGWVFVIDAATFVVSAVTLTLMRVPAIRGTAEHASFWTELADGWRAVVSRRWYLLNLLGHATWNFAIASVFVLGPIVTIKHLGGASSWGLVGAAMGAGAIAGGLVALRVTPSRPLIAANLVLVFGTVQLLAFAVPLPLPLVMVASALGWAGLTFLNELWFATVPQLLPKDVLARANSFDWLLSIIAMPAGFAVSGPLADRIGVTPTLVAAAALTAAAAVFVLLVPGVRRVRRTPEGRIVLDAATTTAPTPAG